MEVVKSCSEVHLVLYCIMHSDADPGLERTKNLSKRRERGNIKTKHVKSIDRMGIRCQVEKNQQTDETKIC